MSDGIRHSEVWRKGWLSALPLSVSMYGISDLFRPSWNCLYANLYCLSGNDFYSIGVLIGYGLGRYIDPDLDQASITSAEGRMINEIPVLGHFLYGYWTIYGSLFRKKHRSFITHFPGVSTGVRIVYQFWSIFLLIYMKGVSLSENPWIVQTFIGIFFGLSLADFFHWIEDIRSNEIRLKLSKSRT